MDVVYIDDQIIDLDPKTSIAWTIQRIDIGDISKNYASFSNTIKASDTERNNRVFQNSKLINSDGTFQYALQDCKVVQKGIETINGKCQIISFDGEKYSIVIYDSFVSLLSFIDGKDLSNIDFGSNSWAASAIDTARLSTSGFVAAVMNWGRSSIYEANYFLPCYYYSTLIQKILQLTGYSVSGSILSSTDFTDLVCTPFDKFKYEESIKNNNTSLSKSTNQSNGFTVDLEQDTILFQTLSYGNPLSFESPNGYESLDNFECNIDISINFSAIAFVGSVGSNLFISIAKNGTIISSGAGFRPTGIRTLSFTNLDLSIGDTVSALVSFSQNLITDSVTFTISSVSTLTVTATTTVVRTSPKWNKLTIKKSLRDVLKDFFVRFGIVYKVEGNTLILKTLDEICTDTASAVDWTSKRVNRKKSGIEFKTNYAQANYFLHQDDAKDNFLGSGSLAIANTTLQTAKDFFTSVFSNARRWTGTGYEVMSTPAYDSTSTGIDDIKEDPPLMIGTLKARTTEAAITFDAIARTDYKLAYHADASQTKDSSFRYFLSKYYTSLTFALQKNKICKYEYNLNELDIASYDPHKMIFDNGSYYLINKIENFRSGKITKVELFKIQ